MNPSRLIDQLNSLGVYFLRGNSLSPAMPLDSTTFLSALANSDEARLRLALIPLLLRCPDVAEYAPIVAFQLSQSAQVLFICYYTAAMLLQQKYRSRLENLIELSAPLSDHFSAELGLLPHQNPETDLRLLGEQQKRLSGQSLNWYGTYHHAAERFIIHLERRKLWTISTRFHRSALCIPKESYVNQNCR